MGEVRRLIRRSKANRKVGITGSSGRLAGDFPRCPASRPEAYGTCEGSLGYRVKEMLGGYEYWVREGFTVEDTSGVRNPETDPFTAPDKGIACAC